MNANTLKANRRSVPLSQVLGVFCVLLCGPNAMAVSAPRPNVVFIMMDDMNGYGALEQYPVLKMPHLDRLRAESINFRLAVCASPVCTPSRASFMSGLYPHHTGAYLNGCDPWRTSPRLQSIESLPECFKRNGYETWGRGKIFHAQLEPGR